MTKIVQWIEAQKLKLVLCFAAIFIVMYYPGPDASPAFFGLIVVMSLLTSFTGTAMFISQVLHVHCLEQCHSCDEQGVFFARISDPTIGGTYLTVCFNSLFHEYCNRYEYHNCMITRI